MKLNREIKVSSFISYRIKRVQSEFCELRLPRLISDGMVMQRDAKVNIWGWAIPHEVVTVHFINEVYTTKVGLDGKWNIILPPLKAGGPYNMEIKTSKSIILKDILIGDVWICSGQSNMVLPMARVSDLYEEDIALSYNLSIRLFKVPDRYEFNVAQQDFQQGSWETANFESILHFSATGYFFARALFERYQVPIGLINASVGGSPVEAWLSEDSLKKFPNYQEIANRFKDDNYIKHIVQEDEKVNNNWYESLDKLDKGLVGSELKWFDMAYDDSDWSTMQVPAYWEDEGLGPINGVVWFRKEINISREIAKKASKLLLGRIVDSDSVYVNGMYIGTTTYQYPPRRYAIPGNVLKEGKNIIVIRVVNNSSKGGFIKDKPYQIVVGKEVIDLKGEWKYKVGAVSEPLRETTFIQYKPLGLFNGMISPLLNYTIKGTIWYQGESNAARAGDYQKLFAEMIFDWRKKWNQGDFPFLYVQLPNYGENKNFPEESDWAELREAQLKTLEVNNTEMAVTIDAGEWNDLHPLNKKTIGSRLALLAQKLAYGDDKIVSYGPLYESIKVEEKKIIITFTSVGSGLIAKDGLALKHFAIAGVDGKFLWANAIIEGDKVVVWNDEIDIPISLRYAWADNPENANLYNKEGLPASPFRIVISEESESMKHE